MVLNMSRALHTIGQEVNMSVVAPRVVDEGAQRVALFVNVSQAP